jgi:uncharacterized protein YxjI
MKYIKAYDQYNESLVKKAFMGAALVGSLAACDPSGRPIDTTGMEQSSIKFEIPNQFTLKEKIISVGTDMEIFDTEGKYLGEIEERTLSFGSKFQLYDVNGIIISSGKSEVFEWGINFEIFDSSGSKIGSFEQEVLESLFSIETKYTIKDSSGTILATSKKSGLFLEDIEIFDTNKKTCVKYSEKVSVGGEWECEVFDNKIDKRLYLFIPSFVKTSRSKSSHTSKR